MKMKPQGRLEGHWLGSILKTRPAVIASNWVFQGMRYMNAYEVFLKLALDLIIFVIILLLWGGSVTVTSMFILAIIAHGINWIVNGHFFVLMRYVYPIPKTQQDFDEYVAGFALRAKRSRHVDGLAIYGSYCRGQLHEFSDLDVRVIVQGGLLSGMSGALFCVKERFIALFKVFPLDIYCCIETASLNRLRDDEKPTIIFDKSGMLERYYQTRGI